MNRSVFRCVWVCGALVFILLGCKEHYTPLPRGYFRIEFPQRAYRQLDSVFPYRFEYPNYVAIVPNQGANGDPNWIDLKFSGMNAIVHLSYKKLNHNLDEVMEDSRKLAYKHSIKAEAIGERMYANPDLRVYGILYEIRGNAASPLQFALTDSVTHFLRGSLYFHAVPNKDSLAPVVQFVQEDLIHLMETLSWKN